MTSYDDTIISLPGQSITDAQGNTWSIVNGQVAVNGVVDKGTGRVIQMAYENGLIWQKNADNLWWSKSGPNAAWSPPYGTTVNPMPYSVPSGDDAVARTAGHSIVDAAGNTWAIQNGQVTLNGVVDPTTANVVELAYKNGKIWQENTANLWWSKTRPSDQWGPPYGTATSPVVQSTTKTWTLTTPFVSGNFLDAENWSGGVAPNPGDTAVINRGIAYVSGPPRPGALGEGGLTLLLGSPDPAVTAELETTVDTTVASAMTIITGSATAAASAHYLGTIFTISDTLTNEGHINVVAGAASAELDIRLRNATFVNYGVINETGAKGALKWFGSTQYGVSGQVTNNGLISVNGGQIDVETYIGGNGSFQINSNGSLKIGYGVAVGSNIAINAGMLEFGPVVDSPNPGWATNPGLHFLGSLSFGSASGAAPQTAVEGIKLDGVSQAGTSLSVVLSNIQPGIAEMTVFQGSTKILDASLQGHYDATEFTAAHSGSDVTVMFHNHTLTAAIPHS